jgi:hypothetical protein
MLLSMLNVLYIYISTFRSTCAVPNMAVFCSSLISFFPSSLLNYFIIIIIIIIIIMVVVLILNKTVNILLLKMTLSLPQIFNSYIGTHSTSVLRPLVYGVDSCARQELHWW